MDIFAPHNSAQRPIWFMGPKSQDRNANQLKLLIRPSHSSNYSEKAIGPTGPHGPWDTLVPHPRARGDLCTQLRYLQAHVVNLGAPAESAAETVNTELFGKAHPLFSPLS